MFNQVQKLVENNAPRLCLPIVSSCICWCRCVWWWCWWCVCRLCELELFFKWYPPVVSPPLSSVVSASAGVFPSGIGAASAICASSSCFFRWYSLVASTRHLLLCLLVPMYWLVVLVFYLLFVWVRVVFLDDTLRLRLPVIHLFV